MAKGLSVPIGVDGTGGTLWVEGEPNDRKTIMTSLGDCESENAFQQDLGLGAEMVFANSTVDLRSSIMRRVKSIFLEFRRQHRYKLLNNKYSDLHSLQNKFFHYLYPYHIHHYTLQ